MWYNKGVTPKKLFNLAMLGVGSVSAVSLIYVVMFLDALRMSGQYMLNLKGVVMKDMINQVLENKSLTVFLGVVIVALVFGWLGAPASAQNV